MGYRVLPLNLDDVRNVLIAATTSNELSSVPKY